MVPAVHLMVGWWLDSGTGVAAMLGCVTALGLYFGRGAADGLPRRALALWAGAMAANVGVLFWIGPGNIWPIALVIAGVLVLTAVVAGAAVAWIVRSLTK